MSNNVSKNFCKGWTKEIGSVCCWIAVLESPLLKPLSDKLSLCKRSFQLTVFSNQFWTRPDEHVLLRLQIFTGASTNIERLTIRFEQLMMYESPINLLAMSSDESSSEAAQITEETQDLTIFDNFQPTAFYLFRTELSNRFILRNCANIDRHIWSLARTAVDDLLLVSLTCFVQKVINKLTLTLRRS